MSSSTGKYLPPSQRQQLLEILTEANIPSIDRKGIQIILFTDEGKSQAELLLIPESALRPILKKTLLQQAREIEQVLGTKTEETDKKSDRADFPSPAQQLGHWIGQSLRRYPFFEQQSASDCGAASLVMIPRFGAKESASTVSWNWPTSTATEHR